MANLDLGDEKRANAAARRAMGETAWPTMCLAAGLFVAYGLVLGSYIAGSVPLWLAVSLLAVIVYATYTVVHEAVHGSICGQNTRLRWLNEALGYAGGQLIGAPFTAHRKEHFAHHNHTNHAGADPDLALASGSLGHLILGAFRVLPHQVAYYARNNWQKASGRDRTLLVGEIALAIGWRLALVPVIGWWAAFWLLIVANLAGIFITLVLFAWIVHLPHKITGRYRDTGTFVFAGRVDTVVSWLWLFQNYHSIHHLFPRVPFYRYRQVFREIEPVMQRNASPIRHIEIPWPEAGAAARR